MDRAPHVPPQVEAATLPQASPACNGGPTTLEHADAMLAYLRSVPAGYGHELARAMLASSTLYLRETFGQQHAVAVAAALVLSVLGVGEPTPAGAAPIGAEATAEIPTATLH